MHAERLLLINHLGVIEFSFKYSRMIFDSLKSMQEGLAEWFLWITLKKRIRKI